MSDELLSELIAAYGDSILRMCYLYLKDYHLAEDVVQETFIQVYHHYDSFRQQSSVRTWIIQIAVNL
ncbi:MAG: sigma-70 family RNA polymerase sigma factor, partial [Lachnospiraceae bacterium]|nr:sigma-70 family RNA polymerase sigma factor [Lachnospiraceae bacterium]